MKSFSCLFLSDNPGIFSDFGWFSALIKTLEP